ncbi:uncharacterized protein LOC133896026 [Phragmites australis]|uniref:uncharacterized protein LOC133896026 n=1 Tax=Phragmites australis TaxID=29695 RepID=UPI002D77D294|nr:uncharacterized protein LOC133896026 [Phragmites australis]
MNLNAVTLRTSGGIDVGIKLSTVQFLKGRNLAVRCLSYLDPDLSLALPERLHRLSHTPPLSALPARRLSPSLSRTAALCLRLVAVESAGGGPPPAPSPPCAVTVDSAGGVSPPLTRGTPSTVLSLHPARLLRYPPLGDAASHKPRHALNSDLALDDASAPTSLPDSPVNHGYLEVLRHPESTSDHTENTFIAGNESNQDRSSLPVGASCQIQPGSRTRFNSAFAFFTNGLVRLSINRLMRLKNKLLVVCY